jgi:hypothetical protein
LIYLAGQDSEAIKSKPIERTLTASSKPPPNLKLTIRKIDFKNFRYSSVYMNIPDSEPFEPKDCEKGRTGEEHEATLQHIEDGDVTIDGNPG